jgi:hypothetical protein
MYVFDWLKLDIINVVKNEKFYHALPVPQYSDCLMAINIFNKNRNTNSKSLYEIKA